jgi:GNAT superfamily N-acetyltransferase
VPIIILARIATAKASQGKGVGASLLKDAMKRAASAADIVGARALVAHAKNDSARSFFERFDFISSPTNPLHLFLLMKDLQRFIK